MEVKSFISLVPGLVQAGSGGRYGKDQGQIQTSEDSALIQDSFQPKF
jgi:hypothetical protein